jgi:small subunit ribosomal protein S4e
MGVMKRNAAPRFRPIKVKEKTYVVKPLPGPHSKMECVPLGLVLRDMLGIAKTMNEARQILNEGQVKINGITRKERGFPIGLMDIVEISGDHYRMLPTKYGLGLVKTDAKDAEAKLAKVKNKTHLKKRKIQLNLHDGTNLLVDKDEFKTSDVIIINVTDGKIASTIRFEKGSTAVVTDGTNRGLVGTIENIDRKLKRVSLKSHAGEVLVPIKYVFVLGHQKPMIKTSE